MCNDVTKQTFYQNNAIVITRHAASQVCLQILPTVLTYPRIYVPCNYVYSVFTEVRKPRWQSCSLEARGFIKKRSVKTKNY